MNDQKTFKHGEEGSHSACPEVEPNSDGETECCECTGHNCKPDKTIVNQIVKSFSDMPEKEKREIITKATKASNKVQKELMEKSVSAQLWAKKDKNSPKTRESGLIKSEKISFKDGLKIVKKIQKKVNKSEKECQCKDYDIKIYGREWVDTRGCSVHDPSEPTTVDPDSIGVEEKIEEIIGMVAGDGSKAGIAVKKILTLLSEVVKDVIGEDGGGGDYLDNIYRGIQNNLRVDQRKRAREKGVGEI